MRITALFPLCIAGALLAFPTNAQDKPEGAKSEVKEADPEEKTAEEKKPIEAKSNVKKQVPHDFFINVHAGGGFYLFRGDVMDNAGTTVHRLGNKLGYHFGLGVTLTRWLDLNLNAAIGNLNGNERSNRVNRNRNFLAKTFGIGAELTYNFKNIGFFKQPRVMVPFVGTGVYFNTFDVYQDLKRDDTGETYYYWEDDDDEINRNQWIMPVDQNNPISDIPEDELLRDFEYESKVYESPVRSIAFPVVAGADFHIDRKWAFRIKAGYFFTMTDAIDGYDDPKHSENLDGYWYTSMSVFFKFNPFKKRPEKGEVPMDYVGDFGPLVNEDSDKDGVVDFLDKCSGTPEGVTVNSSGCAKDTDGDGIPDYRDDQKNTVAGYIVDEKGVALSYKAIYEDYKKDTVSILRRNVDRDWLYSQVETDPKYTVHVGTFTNYDIPTQLKMKLSAMSGLVERKISDSVSVFTLGSFDNFEAAEAKQNQLIKSGIDQAFGVNERAIKSVANDMTELKVAGPIFSNREAVEEKDEPDVLDYGVELREYRLRLDINKLSSVIAKYGVEMTTTTGGMKIYRIGSFAHFEDAENLRKSVSKLGVKDPTISPRLNDQSITVEKAKELEPSINPKEDEKEE